MGNPNRPRLPLQTSEGQKGNSYGVYIAGPDKAAMEAVADQIIKILKCSVEQETLRKALDTFSVIGQPTINIDDNTIRMENN